MRGTSGLDRVLTGVRASVIFVLVLAATPAVAQPPPDWPSTIWDDESYGRWRPPPPQPWDAAWQRFAAELASGLVQCFALPGMDGWSERYLWLAVSERRLVAVDILFGAPQALAACIHRLPSRVRRVRAPFDGRILQAFAYDATTRRVTAVAPDQPTPSPPTSVLPPRPRTRTSIDAVEWIERGGTWQWRRELIAWLRLVLQAEVWGGNTGTVRVELGFGEPNAANPTVRILDGPSGLRDHIVRVLLNRRAYARYRDERAVVRLVITFRTVIE